VGDGAGGGEGGKIGPETCTGRKVTRALEPRARGIRWAAPRARPDPTLAEAPEGAGAASWLPPASAGSDAGCRSQDQPTIKPCCALLDDGGRITVVDTGGSGLPQDTGPVGGALRGGRSWRDKAIVRVLVTPLQSGSHRANADWGASPSVSASSCGDPPGGSGSWPSSAWHGDGRQTNPKKRAQNHYRRHWVPDRRRWEGLPGWARETTCRQLVPESADRSSAGGARGGNVFTIRGPRPGSVHRWMGHAPGRHAWPPSSPEANVLISGDQVLSKITTKT